MKWIEESENRYYCDTPVGKFTSDKSIMGWEVYFNNEWITDGKTLEEGKDEARNWIHTKYYLLKIYLEL